MLIVKDKPRIITIKDKNLVCSFNKREKYPKSGLILGLTDTATNPQKPMKNTIGIIITKATNKLLIKIFNTSLELALGVMIIASAPGGVTSNVLTKFANGDVALSISLTAIISLISILSVPFIVFMSADLLGASNISNEISMISISIKMFLVVTLPVALGMLIRKFATNFIISKTKLIQNISIFLFIIVFMAIWVEEWENIASYIVQAGVITLTLNIIMMTVGYYAGKFFASGIPQKKCISLECGLQNGTLAVFVASQLFNDVTFLIPTAAYALIMFLTSLIFVFIVRKTA